jgi:Tol biopolymer transport system component
MRMSPLATRGDVSDVAIAHDGKLLAYVVGESALQTIHLREISAPNDRIAIVVDQGSVSGIMFSPDDSYLYYRRTANDGIGELLRLPAKGGVPEHVAGDVSGAAALSPDGKQVAFVRLSPSSWEASLMVGNVDGSGEFPLQIARRPRYFDEESVAWSPDGKAIACFSGEMTSEGTSTFRLVEINLHHPAQRLITSQRWIPRGLAWAAPGDVLIVTAVSPGDLRQLWTVRRDTGEVTRLTNDLNTYGRVSITGDGKSMVAVQSQISQTIWAATGNDNSRFERVTTTPLSLRTAVAWTVDGKIIYTDPADGYRNIWRMDPNGANPQRLTSSPIDKDELAQTSDGRYIVYQQHESHIWRIRSDGSDPKQLTTGRHDVHPALTPDGNSVIYASFADWTPGIGGEPTLWRVPIDGGQAVQVTQQPTSIPSVSPDGKHIACIYFPGRDPRLSSALLAVTRIDGNGGFTTFPRSYRDETTISWSPDGKGVDFVKSVSGAGNIWRQPLKGGPPVQITHFDRDELTHFAWSRDGRLLCTRGNTTHKAILIQNFR